jgi:hypothetical protein
LGDDKRRKSLRLVDRRNAATPSPAEVALAHVEQALSSPDALLPDDVVILRRAVPSLSGLDDASIRSAIAMGIERSRIRRVILLLEPHIGPARPASDAPAHTSVTTFSAPTPSPTDAIAPDDDEPFDLQVANDILEERVLVRRFGVVLLLVATFVLARELALALLEAAWR